LGDLHSFFRIHSFFQLHLTLSGFSDADFAYFINRFYQTLGEQVADSQFSQRCWRAKNSDVMNMVQENVQWFLFSDTVPNTLEYMTLDIYSRDLNLNHF
jgi:hypothetical protein